MSSQPPEDPPIVLGSGGLMGRQPVRPVHDEEPLESDGPQYAHSMPANCIRVLNSPHGAERGGGCDGNCAGRQSDGGCLVDIVRAAHAQGIAPTFALDRDNVWVYNGPPLG